MSSSQQGRSEHAARSSVVTRFAPSPTGDLHLGNARTALFNLLYARRAGGRFLLRIEDTDTERSSAHFQAQQLEDLRWLGLDWDAGPDREDAHGPYHQSQRTPLYARYFAALAEAGRLYECYCSAIELEVSRRAQLAAGKPPRYAGTCRDLTPAERERRRAAGIAPTLRFHVLPGRRIEFVDLVHGPQSFQSDDIGDFIVRRADGSAAFFFSNAVDDASMGVTHVLRGEDHLTNTPRQLLLLEALGLPAPLYGHVSLLLGHDGAPLSKRHGAASVREYRARGYLPAALDNYLFRLGHSSTEHGFLSLEELARHFDPAHLGRAPAHFDEQQLTSWQKEAVRHLDPAAVRAWLGAVLPPGIDEPAAGAFVEAVRPNVILPEDARVWADIIFGEPPPVSADDAKVITEAGPAYFAAAASAVAGPGAAGGDPDLPAIIAAIRAATGRKGTALYLPLRLALTGLTHGPELALLLKTMPAGTVRARLARYAR